MYEELKKSLDRVRTVRTPFSSVSGFITSTEQQFMCFMLLQKMGKISTREPLGFTFVVKKVLPYVTILSLWTLFCASLTFVELTENIQVQLNMSVDRIKNLAGHEDHILLFCFPLIPYTINIISNLWGAVILTHSQLKLGQDPLTSHYILGTYP